MNNFGVLSASKAIPTICALFFFTIVPGNRANADTEALSSLSLPTVTKFFATDGLAAYRIKSEIPALTITASIGYGSLYETSDNAGISSVLVKTISLAGSKKFPGQSLYRTIENLGGKIHFDASWEEITITISILDRYAETAFAILSDIVQNPRIENESLSHARSLVKESIKRQRDMPHLVAFEALREILFDGNGYGATPSEKSLNSINSESLNEIIRQHFTSGNTILGISSLLEGAHLEKLAKKYFSGIRKGSRMRYTVNTKDLAEKFAKNAGKIFLIPRDIPQATIAIGAIAPPLGCPDEFSLASMNYILGGGSFNSRLMTEIRTKRGLSYSTASVVRFRKETGLFLAYAQTRDDAAAFTLKLMIDNINEMKTKEVTHDELTWMRLSIENSYIFEFDTPRNILSKYLFLDYYNLSESYLSTYLEKIRAVSAPSIMQSAKNLFGKGVVKVVVGKKELEPKLSEQGEVVMYVKASSL